MLTRIDHRGGITGRGPTDCIRCMSPVFREAGGRRKLTR